MTVADPESLRDEGGYYLRIFQSSLNLIAHLLVGVVVGCTLLFVVTQGLPLALTQRHIVLCVIGYHLLMAEAILSLSNDNGWSSSMKLKDKRRAHTVMQVVGSLLALFGSFEKMYDKSTNFNTMHGIFGLIAVVFTSVSLVNGLASWYAYEWRKCCPGNVSKITHICFGSFAFIAASICLCYGFDKTWFRMWATEPFTYTLITFTALLTFIIIINPMINFYKKTSRFITK
ncbi:unnamed protein product [Leptidea sinapis]|uniref:ascorbate ferrireductase (transmembrane) n=1 Tax=Leptidea sinapis TaxID=189913 RepID=A0A5E4QAY2_9NEOP|nr:unnamed protein product [Leptidea sinapis]